MSPLNLWAIDCSRRNGSSAPNRRGGRVRPPVGAKPWGGSAAAAVGGPQQPGRVSQVLGERGRVAAVLAGGRGGPPGDGVLAGRVDRDALEQAAEERLRDARAVALEEEVGRADDELNVLVQQVGLRGTQ